MITASCNECGAEYDGAESVDCPECGSANPADLPDPREAHDPHVDDRATTSGEETTTVAEPLDGYTIAFFKVMLFNTWSWRITTPDGRILGPSLGIGWAERARAEQEALKCCEQDASRDELTLTAVELRTKLGRADG